MPLDPSIPASELCEACNFSPAVTKCDCDYCKANSQDGEGRLLCGSCYTANKSLRDVVNDMVSA